MDNDLAAMLGQAVLDRRNILIAGATGSGKTTIAKALIEAIPLDERLVTIEDTAEWNSIPHRNHGNRCGGITYKFCARVEMMSSVAD